MKSSEAYRGQEASWVLCGFELDCVSSRYLGALDSVDLNLGS